MISQHVVSRGWTGVRILGCLPLLMLASLVLTAGCGTNRYEGSVGGGPRSAVSCGEGESLTQGGDGSEDVTVGPGTCFVHKGTYRYHNFNVYLSGVLQFVDDGNTDLWAESILIENNGALIAGSPATPYGQNGTLVIHLWGKDQGTGTGNKDGGAGILCQSDAKNQCGVPDAIWNSNLTSTLNPPSCQSLNLPGNVKDCFYQYAPIDYDDGMTNGSVGYFGYKVLAVSYGGTLQLFGKKGASYSALGPSNSGTSWARLSQSVAAGGTQLTLDRSVDWAPNDNIVVTTTDYLPAHSEQLTVGTNDTSSGHSVITLISGQTIQHAHNGATYDLAQVPSGVGPDQDPNATCSAGQTRCVETRAAVGLLSRSIRIVSAGDGPMDDFPAPVAGCGDQGNPPCYFFGAHTIARQGFASFQVQGVEFYQMGTGGRIMHYPIHFHMSRQTPQPVQPGDPPVTFVQDSTVWDSMTRWYTIHGTQGATLARNVGYLSIGHGYYLEDGSETNNHLYANLGALARGGMLSNPQNPRNVPGILASSHHNEAADEVPYHTDIDHPTVFWMMNGWNDIQYNMASGAGSCGMCYWLVPGTNSGISRYEYWDSYAGEQQPNGTADYTRGGISPVKSFVGNSCSSAQNSLTTIGDTSPCDIRITLSPIVNPLAPDSSDARADAYYPKVAGGASRAATACPETGDCRSVPPCAYLATANCMITAIDHYTSSFNWAQTNLAAIWLRKQWFLFSNSAVTDVQNGGLTFVSGGGYTGADEVPGYWALAHKNVFIGMTQPSNPFASEAGPFNPNSGLNCDQNAPASFCPSLTQGITLPLDAFAVNQRLFNIYDGPSYQSSNAYLDITKTTLTGCTPGGGGDCSQWMYWRSLGVPLDPSAPANSECYLPNAAVAWKQPNGFYYPPAFHSDNLFLKNVDIHHFVIEPLFKPGTFITDDQAVKVRYCIGASDMFNGYSDIDRQTELSDDDGSLTGLVGPVNPQTNENFPSISINKDIFFNVPVETPECLSDIPSLMPQGVSCPYNAQGHAELCATANTSPYDYVTTVEFPGCATDKGGGCTDWGSDCTGRNCYGVPLYREQTNPGESGASAIRMMAQDTSQRSNLTANNARYYIDTTVSADIQSQSASSLNVFKGGQTYYTFLLFAKPTTQQTYQFYVGKDFDTGTLRSVRVDQESNPPSFQEGDALACATGPGLCFDPGTGILTVALDMSQYSDFAANYEAAKENHCAPASFCTWNSGNNSCGCNPNQNLASPGECQNACAKWATKDVNCPKGGCYGFGFTLPGDFVAGTPAVPPPNVSCFPKGTTARPSPWNVKFSRGGNPGACSYPTLPSASFCSNLDVPADGKH